MNVFNGDVTINPKNLEVLISSIKKLTDEVSAVRADIAKLSVEGKLLREEIQKARCNAGFVPEMECADEKQDAMDLRNFMDISKEESGMSVTLLNALYRAGVYTIEDLRYLDEWSVKRIRHLGDKSFQILKKYMDKKGVELPKKFKDVKPGIPEILEGDFVMALVDSGTIKKGEIVKVDSVRKINSYHGTFYCGLPVYCCRNDAKTPEVFSVSQVRKV